MSATARSSFAVILAAILTGCTTVSQSLVTTSTPVTVATVGTIQSPLVCPGALRYRPLPAFAATNYTDHSLGNDGKLKTETKFWPTGDKRNESVNRLLPNIAAAISVDELVGQGEVGPFFRSTGRRQRITIDFMKYRSEPVADSNDKVFMYSRIGAGLRLTIDIVTADSSLSAGGLIALAVSAKAGLTRGTITAEVIGLDNRDVTLSMPFTSDVSDGSIQSIIEALAVVKSKLHDKETYLDPQFIARIDCVEAKAVQP